MVVRGGEAYEVGKDTTLEGDLYYLGKTFVLTGTSTDDLFALGSTISLPGKVGGDVFAIGGEILTGGTVAGDMRLAGGEITLASTTISEDLVVLGGTIIVAKGTVVKGDLLVYGDRFVLDGVVEGNVEAHVRTAEIRGSVGHDTSITARESISLTDQAHLKGPFLYTAPRKAFIPDGVKVDGETSFELAPQVESESAVDMVPSLVTLLMSVVAALMFVFLLPRFSVQTTASALLGGGMLAVKSLVLLVAWPMLGLVLCMTVVGMVPGFLLLISYVFTVILALAFTPVIAGVVLARWLKKETILSWDWTILGALCLMLVGFIPFVGFLVRLVLFLSAFGVFTFGLLSHIRAQRQPLASVVSGEQVPHGSTHAVEETATTEEKADAPKNDSAS